MKLISAFIFSLILSSSFAATIDSNKSEIDALKARVAALEAVTLTERGVDALTAMLESHGLVLESIKNDPTPESIQAIDNCLIQVKAAYPDKELSIRGVRVLNVRNETGFYKGSDMGLWVARKNVSTNECYRNVVAEGLRDKR